MSCKVELRKQGASVRTVTVPYLGAHLLEPRAHGCVSWLTTAVYTVTACSQDGRNAVAEYSHLEKHTLDIPRDPKRFPA